MNRFSMLALAALPCLLACSGADQEDEKAPAPRASTGGSSLYIAMGGSTAATGGASAGGTRGMQTLTSSGGVTATAGANPVAGTAGASGASTSPLPTPQGSGGATGLVWSNSGGVPNLPPDGSAGFGQAGAFPTPDPDQPFIDLGGDGWIQFGPGGGAPSTIPGFPAGGTTGFTIAGATGVPTTAGASSGGATTVIRFGSGNTAGTSQNTF
ncbi:MAG TPA: hypothetical protein VFQ61_38710 [Polyangiaceae bacterium]|nr:hypothetical protein [Polyangiaceae bacterium]